MESVRTNFILITVLLALTVPSLIVSCASNKGALQVRQYHLSSVKPASKEAQMVRGEQMYRLRGAVTMEERQQRLGHYYTVSWKNDQPSLGRMQVVMDYQQASTGSQVHRMSRDLPAGTASGRVEFSIAGDSYRVGGRVLSWRIRLIRDGKVIEEKRSYLWR